MGNESCSDNREQFTEEPIEKDHECRYESLPQPEQISNPTKESFSNFFSSQSSELSFEEQIANNAKTDQNYFKMQTGGVSTDSILLEDSKEKEESQQFENSIDDSIDDSESIDFGINRSYQYPTIEPKMSSLVKHKSADIDNRYLRGKVIGMGKKSKIYHGQNRKTGKLRAIKSLNPQNQMNSGASKQVDSKNESMLLSQFDHPNIIRLFEVFQNKGKQFMVLEFCEGGNLITIRRLLEKKNIPQNIRKFIFKYLMKQILQGLVYIHSKGYAHLNLKMKKIMLLHKEIFPIDENLVKILDLSHARFANNDLTRDESICPKILLFGSPEQNSCSSYCLKTDVWHVGVIFFSFITGGQPYILEKRQYEGKSFLHYKKNEQKWKKIQQNHLRELLRNMLEVDYKLRWSSLKCLEHEWIIDSNIEGKSNLKNQILDLSKRTKRKTNLFTHVEALTIFRNSESKEFEAISKAFRELDEDCSGSVRLQELVAGLGKLQNNNNFSSLLAQAIEILNDLDTNHSGEIDYNQFFMVLANKEKVFKKQLIQEIFESMDNRNSGYVGKEDLLRQIKGVTSQQYDYYLQKMGIADGEKISKTQFVNYILNQYKVYYENY